MINTTILKSYLHLYPELSKDTNIPIIESDYNLDIYIPVIARHNLVYPENIPTYVVVNALHTECGVRYHSPLGKLLNHQTTRKAPK